MTLNEKIMGAMIVVLMVTIAMLALSSCSDSIKVIMYDYYIAECQKEHEKPCEIYAKVVE